MRRARFLLTGLAGTAGILGWRTIRASANTTTLYIVTASGAGKNLAIWDRHDALVARSVTRQTPQPLRLATAHDATLAPFHATIDGIPTQCEAKAA